MTVLLAMVLSAFPYDLAHPARTVELPKQLDEISDLALALDGTSAWAVHDEKKHLFRISLEDGSVLEKKALQDKKGDFEGVTTVRKDLYAARSDGVVIKLDARDWKPRPIETGLAERCNVEGLTFDRSKERLLLACKRALNASRTWEVYAYDLLTQTLQRKPVIELEAKRIEERATQPIDAKDIDPSALVMNPVTHELYVLSSRAKLLVVLSGAGAVKEVHHLDPELFPQPEGLTFGKGNTLYISSEGKNGRPATLSRFDPK